MELRQAYRNRDIALKKQVTKSSSSMSDLRNASHFVITINNTISFLDLAAIESLTSSVPHITKALTGNFATMTNEILKRSAFYSEHQFETSE